MLSDVAKSVSADRNAFTFSAARKLPPTKVEVYKLPSDASLLSAQIRERTVFPPKELNPILDVYAFGAEMTPLSPIVPSLETTA